ncbi:hypothetical protein AVEN_139353-1 [Araneus ventricosus]|uniref:Uncharacterized protein n=1 Tax=Araneus ventricosus TaxID=182803 RepID=A0A4Y2TPJ5_ARAVE|nr:hypothetical protein AVEN_139353-1 [Araneus ventricosus]
MKGSTIPGRAQARKTKNSLKKCVNSVGVRTLLNTGVVRNFRKLKIKLQNGKPSLLFSTKGKEKSIDSNTKTPNQTVQLADTLKNSNTDLSSSQESKFSLPQDLKANKEKLADLLRILRQIRIILARVPDVKKTLKEMEKPEDPSNKFFILAEEFFYNISAFLRSFHSYLI